MTYTDVLSIAGAVIASFGGGALIVAAFSHWLGNIWAKRMLQNERALHSTKLAEIQTALDSIKHKDITRHNDKLSVYRDAIDLVSEMLRELESVANKKQSTINSDIEHSFSVNRNKAYGYISLVSSQVVMNKYNELIDFMIPVIYHNEACTWSEIREKSDDMLNAMRQDLGFGDSDISYQGKL